MKGADSDSLCSLIARLQEASVQSDHEAKRKHKFEFDASFDAMLAGQSYGQALGGLAILNQPEGAFRSELKSIDDDLGRQIEIVNEALDMWFAKGALPPPYYAWRIAIILGKEKRKDEETDFLKAWCKHFGNCSGSRYESIASRARKLGAI